MLRTEIFERSDIQAVEPQSQSPRRAPASLSPRTFVPLYTTPRTLSWLPKELSEKNIWARPLDSDGGLGALQGGTALRLSPESESAGLSFARLTLSGQLA